MSDEPIKKGDLVMVQASGCRHVGLKEDVYEQFNKLDDKAKAQLERRFKHFGTPNTTMPSEHFKAEDRFPTGRAAEKVMVYAFKAFQVRIYGPLVAIDGVSTFIGLEMAVKKRDKANQNQLRRVARNSTPYLAIKCGGSK